MRCLPGASGCLLPVALSAKAPLFCYIDASSPVLVSFPLQPRPVEGIVVDSVGKVTASSGLVEAGEHPPKKKPEAFDPHQNHNEPIKE